MPNKTEIMISLDSWQVVIIFLGTTICSAICIVWPFYLISKNENMVTSMSKTSPIYLRYLTVLLVIWSAAVLAVVGRMDEGPSAIFGMIIGYVFGAVNKPLKDGPSGD